MKKIISLLIFCLAWDAHAILKQDCSNVQRAVNTDQQILSLRPTFGYFEIGIKKLVAIGIDDYASWKVEQDGCLANVVHYGVARATYLDASETSVCTTTFTVHAKDYFVGVSQSEREYKIRDAVEQCSQDEETLAKVESCKSTGVRCFKDGQVLDVLGDCTCKSVYNLVQYEDKSEDYVDFFNPANAFEKPEQISSPFSPEEVQEEMEVE